MQFCIIKTALKGVHVMEIIQDFSKIKLPSGFFCDINLVSTDLHSPIKFRLVQTIQGSVSSQSWTVMWGVGRSCSFTS